MTQTVLPEFRIGRPEVHEAVDISREAYEALDQPFADDEEKSLQQDFLLISELVGYDGRLYAEPPQGIKFDDIASAVKMRRAQSVPMLRKKPKLLWGEGFVPETPSAQLAVFSASELPRVDDLLHFTNMPYRSLKVQNNHVDAIQDIQQRFEHAHPQAILKPLGHRALAMMILMDTIREIDPRSDDFILNAGGILRLPDIRSTSLPDDVFALRGKFFFGKSGYTVHPKCGVGLSIGLRDSY